MKSEKNTKTQIDGIAELARLEMPDYSAKTEQERQALRESAKVLPLNTAFRTVITDTMMQAREKLLRGTGSYEGDYFQRAIIATALEIQDRINKLANIK